MALTPIEKNTPQEDTFPEYSLTPIDSSVARRNTKQEIKTGNTENYFYKNIFALRKILDGLRGTGKPVEECTDEIIEEDRRKQSETDVEVIKNNVENPLGEVKGALDIPFISDQHMVNKPGEVVRTYALEKKGSIGYKIIHWIETGIYKVKEYFNKSELRNRGFQSFIEILPTILETPEEELGEQFEKLQESVGDAEVFKWAWNRAVIFRKKWSNPELQEQLLKELSKEDEDKAKEKVSMKEWGVSKIWQIRNSALKIFLPKLFESSLKDRKDTTLLFMSGGDEAHDGGLLSDHTQVRDIYYSMLKGIDYAKKFLGYIGGNHDQDAREPKNLKELNKYYGSRIFYQEVFPKDEDGKKNLVVGLNTFIMAEEWGEVLELYLEKGDIQIGEDTKTYLREMKIQMEKDQKAVYEKMASFEGNSIIIHAHNSRRFMSYLERNPDIKFKDNVQIKIISGHTHEDSNFRALLDLPNSDGKRLVEVYKSSGFIKINGEGMRLPKGLITEIDDKGNVRIKSVEFSQIQKDEYSKSLGVKVL
ncbi:hypothetical protein HYV12_03555 [Candidatus Dojkabacteria bacterium]|nr:hypothetical protein [Candidatus Dojkabacteria bacterium]